MAAVNSTMLPLGTAAPDFRLPDVSGKTLSLADFKGKPLLVMFICNHCPYVKHIRAGLAQLGRDYIPRGESSASCGLYQHCGQFRRRSINGLLRRHGICQTPFAYEKLTGLYGGRTPLILKGEENVS